MEAELMAQGRRRTDPPPSPWEWLRELVSYWPALLGMLTVIAFILRLEQSVLEIQNTQVLDHASIQIVRSRQDSSQKRAEMRDYISCRMFEILVQIKKDSVSLPRHCDAVFQAVGYR